MDPLSDILNTLGPEIFLILAGVVLLLSTAIAFFVLNKLPLARIYNILRTHYNNECKIFALAPIGYEKTVNTSFGVGRINALIFEWFLFITVAVFLVVALVWTVLLNLGITSINNIQIYASDGYSLAVLILEIKPVVILLLVILPQIFINPMIDLLLVSLIIPHDKIKEVINYRDILKNFKYISLKGIFDTFKFATISTSFFYLSFKIFMLFIGGKLFLSQNVFLINGLGIMFSSCLLLSFRSVALSEMLKK